jgi:hypothetical protein
MRFDARELKPYAEPVSEADLVPGEAYFSVTFSDDDMLIPVVETLVFVGKEGKGMLTFQDVDSYGKGASKGKDGKLFQCKADGLKNVFQYDQALDVLLRCSLRRQKGPSRTRASKG